MDPAAFRRQCPTSAFNVAGTLLGFPEKCTRCLPLYPITEYYWRLCMRLHGSAVVRVPLGPRTQHVHLFMRARLFHWHAPGTPLFRPQALE